MPDRNEAVVLVVDDDPTIRETVVMVLEDEGYATVEAPHGAAALSLVQHHHPAVILLDMRMPVMDGWQFAQAYRELPLPHAPIVTMTAASDAGKWAAEIGANAVLAKPFEIDDLLDTVQKLVA
ncbi:MAG TPA: response regulator [Chloroflexota bacterium]|nr:response regulator [Chloroflexota bacterium]